MAVTSSKILNSGKTNITKLLTGLGSPYSYNGMGVGNNTEAASESDTGLKGGENDALKITAQVIVKQG